MIQFSSRIISEPRIVPSTWRRVAENAEFPNCVPKGHATCLPSTKPSIFRFDLVLFWRTSTCLFGSCQRIDPAEDEKENRQQAQQELGSPRQGPDLHDSPGQSDYDAQRKSAGMPQHVGSGRRTIQAHHRNGCNQRRPWYHSNQRASMPSNQRNATPRMQRSKQAKQPEHHRRSAQGPMPGNAKKRHQPIAQETRQYHPKQTSAYTNLCSDKTAKAKPPKHIGKHVRSIGMQGQCSQIPPPFPLEHQIAVPYA